MVGLSLWQRNKYKCQEHGEDDVSHPIVDLDNSFCFFFIHTSVPTRNMVMPSVDAAKVQTGCYRRVALVIKEYCNLTMSWDCNNSETAMSRINLSLSFERVETLNKQFYSGNHTPAWYCKIPTMPTPLYGVSWQPPFIAFFVVCSNLMK